MITIERLQGISDFHDLGVCVEPTPTYLLTILDEWGNVIAGRRLCGDWTNGDWNEDLFRTFGQALGIPVGNVSTPNEWYGDHYNGVPVSGDKCLYVVANPPPPAPKRRKGSAVQWVPMPKNLTILRTVIGDGTTSEAPAHLVAQVGSALDMKMANAWKRREAAQKEYEVLKEVRLDLNATVTGSK